MSQVEEYTPIPASAARPRTVDGPVVTNPDSVRAGPRGSKVLIVLVASIVLVIVAFAILYMVPAVTG